MAIDATDVISANFGTGTRTFILSLSVPDISAIIGQFENIQVGVDCWEVRVDLLRSHGSNTGSPAPNHVRDQIRLLRESSSLPIVFCLRTTLSGGAFPAGEVSLARELFNIGVEEKCAYIDLDSAFPRALIDELVARARAAQIKTIGSFHSNDNNLTWDNIEVLDRYSSIVSFADIISLNIQTPQTGKEDEERDAVKRFAMTHQAKSPKPVAAVYSTPCSPVAGEKPCSPHPASLDTLVSYLTHPALASLQKTPFGSLHTVISIHQALHKASSLPALHFHIFGYNIAHSLSPALHNAGFRALGLPHSYSLHETPSVVDDGGVVAELMASPTFGGASVTFPHKLKIEEAMQKSSPPGKEVGMTEAARKMGAVNTVLVRYQGQGEHRERALMGDNTDWLGISRCILARWKQQPPQGSAAPLSGTTGLVLGAGGAARAACYALREMGVKTLIVVNRTRQSAEKMVAGFVDQASSIDVRIYETLAEAAASTGEEQPIRLIVACVPADDLTEDKIPEALFASGASAGGGVLVEMAYRPQVTGMMKVATRFPRWAIAKGIDILEEQAYAQFELWTGRRAPMAVMRQAMLAAMRDQGRL